MNKDSAFIISDLVYMIKENNMYIVIVQHFTQNIYWKKCTLEFRTSKENMCKGNKDITKQKRNRTYQHKICRAADDDDSRCPFTRQSVCQEMCRLVTGRLHYTHINYLYTIPSVFGSILQSSERTFIFSFCFSLYFYSLNFLPPPQFCRPRWPPSWGIGWTGSVCICAYNTPSASKLSRYTPWGGGGEVYSSYSFLISALDGGEWSASRPLHLVYCQKISGPVHCFFQVKEFLQHFWKEVPLHFMGILGSNAVVNMVGVCDSVLYRSIAGIFVPSSCKVSFLINRCSSAFGLYSLWYQNTVHHVFVTNHLVPFNEISRLLELVTEISNGKACQTGM
jgi:hypothetical protein